jgi:protein O-GlcNAc transferase
MAMHRIAITRFAALRALSLDRSRTRRRPSGEKIRVAVLSADLSDHPVGRTTAALWESLNRAHIELSAYSWTPPKPSAMKTRLDSAFDRLVNVHHLTDAEAAQHIHDDGIDVLIDAMGMTTNERHAILLARPALTNVGFWGYPGTTGGVCDYLIADRVLVATDEHRAHFSEAVVRMPDTYASTASYPDDIRPMSRAVAGLPATAVVLASFNHIGKLTPQCFELWLRILRACPNAVLWLPKPSQTAETSLIDFARARGVESSRFVWHLGGLPEQDYLARLATADVALDCFPYGGHSTTCDILWMGVPLIALTGSSFAARASSSILTAAGLAELACSTVEAYESLTIKLVLDPELRATFRLRAEQARSSALFNQKKYAAALSSALVRIGLRARQLQPAEAFDL